MHPSQICLPASSANNTYRAKLSGCREGPSYSEEELQWLDQVLVPLVKKQQSIHHICATQADKLLCSERTIYKLIDQSALTVRNIDLPRKVRFRPRRPNKPFKVDKNCRLGRTYQDFQDYIQEHPDTAIVQMDSVEGVRGGKVFLTIFFVQSDLLLIYLREHNTSQSVINVFNNLAHPSALESIIKRQLNQKVELLRGLHLLKPVVIVDNGHLLDHEMPEEICFLLNFKLDSKCAMALILVIQGELWDLLKRQV